MERERTLNARAIIVVFAAALAAALIWAAVSLAGGSGGGSGPAQSGATPSLFVQNGNGDGDQDRSDRGRECPNKGGDRDRSGSSDTSEV